MGRVQIDVLGPVEVRLADGAGSLVDLGTPRQRAIVAALALGGGRQVSTDTLIERVWGEDAPAGVLATLHGYVAALRRALEPGRAPRAEPRLLVTVGDGYALRECQVAADVAALESAVASARSALAVLPDHLRPRADPRHQGDIVAVVEPIEEALARWRGEPYAELPEAPAAVAERVRLEGVRTAAQELRAIALLAVGRHAEVLLDLEQLTAQHPLHERWWALYAVALTRAQRQGDALTALQVASGPVGRRARCGPEPAGARPPDRDPAPGPLGRLD